MLQTKEVMSQEQLDCYIEEAAKAGGHEEGFGVRGCDLTKTNWWAAYIRQSLEEQAQNNRLPDYLRTCAQEARKLGVTVPREYILYDAVTGEHLERPCMMRLRELMLGRQISGVIFPALDRLSREPIHVGIFEFQAQYVGVQVHYADAPNGSDPMSQMVRMNIASAAKFVKVANRKNAVGGNIGRVVKGSAPAHRAAYGYRYRREGEIGSDGRLHVKQAWWEVDELGPDGKPLWGRPAWVVVQIFIWVGEEGRTLHWVVKQLNEMGIKSAEGRRWSPGKVHKIVHRECYAGSHTYNVTTRVPNPNKPLGDITAEVKRTLLKPKPQQEWVTFRIPPLVSEDLCRKAKENVASRGEGRGKQGKSINALLRNRIFCPRCSAPMVVRRGGHTRRVYYYCSRYCRPWVDNPCSYNKFIPGTWDDLIWEDICTWLRNDDWVEQQLASQECQDDNTAKLIKLQQWHISQAQAKIAKVQEGFDGGLYNLDEAKKRIAGYQATIAKAEDEMQRLQTRIKTPTSGIDDIVAMREELKVLRDRNLDHATFEEKLDIVSKLGIKVYPSEDLKSMRVCCRLNLESTQTGSQQAKIRSNEMQANGECESLTGCRKVYNAPPFVIT
jgi:site-specific DNA recombinase